MTQHHSEAHFRSHSSSETPWWALLQDLPLDALPAEFWEHLGRALEEAGHALRILAKHVDPVTDIERLYHAYEQVRRDHTHVGTPPQSSD